MGLSSLLEDFGGIDTTLPTEEVTQIALENERLSSYEAGYSAGWDDAVKAQAEDQSQIKAAFAHNLQEISATYQEARLHVTQSMEPLLLEVVEKVVPALAMSTLGLQVSEQLQEMAKECSGNEIELVTNAQDAPVLEDLLLDNVPVTFKITEEETLAEGQVYLRLGSFEREINSQELVAEIKQAVTAFIYETQQEAKYA